VTERTFAACVNHPEREAIGVCVRCRTRVCSECVTKVEGINYCVSCLAVLADRGASVESRRSRPWSLSAASLSAVVYFVFLCLLAWALVEVALPGGG
jgi:hypothetical protein